MTDSQQQFCLRWNNFQANITSQFEALRDDEDFVDVTFACDGRRLQAHKVVLSACSPYFKELFKTNPCKHPIIFMRDVEFEHLQSLLEFMYAGEVNISQAELPTFLRTAESLQIRGLTDSQSNQHNNEKFSKTNNIHTSNGRGLTSPSFDDERSKTPSPSSPPPLKRLCKRSDSPQNSSPVPPAATTASVAATPPTSGPRSRPVIEPHVQLDCYKDVDVVEPKIELPEYGSDDECSTKPDMNTLPGGFLSLDGGMEVLPSYPTSYSGSGIEGGMPGPSHGSSELNQDQQADLRKLHSLDPRPCPVCNRMYSNLSNLRQHMRLIHNPQSVTCPLCNKPFKTKLYLKRHLVSFHELSVADRQRQEEIYHHQVKVEAQRQAPSSQAQGQNQVQGQAQVQAQVQVQGGQGGLGPTGGGGGGGGGILGSGAGGALGSGAGGTLGSVGSGGGPQQTDKVHGGGPPPRLPPDDGATSTTCKIVESKSRPFQAEIVIADEDVIGDEAVLADSGSGSMLVFGSSSVSITGSSDAGGGTCWDSPRVCPVCPRIYSNNSNLRRHVRSAHPTATDLLEMTSLQRKPTAPTVKLLSLDSQVQRPTFPNQSTLNLDDYGDPISHEALNTHSNASMKSKRVRRGRPRLGTRGGRHMTSIHGNSPSRGDWLPLDMRTTPPTMPAFRGFEETSSDGVVHLGEGIAICEEQLRAVKWSDYRKLTRGLAAILFSPTELATCSVTGQRWSRAGTATERPVKPALDKAKVQAIISYVTSRFPSVDVSSVKQVLAYKCKENSTALKMKSIRYICERQDTEPSSMAEPEDK